jgi:NADPH-dependent glutamate synthase beta subunit-like oxidoreductase
MGLIIEREKCLACGTCAEYCVLDNIRVETPPCRAACPLGINPQAYCTLLAMDRADEALAMVYRDTPFPRILGHVCQAPCENSCNRRLVDEPVSIRALKRFLAERAVHPAMPVKAGESTGKTVVVVGAGPAGMMAAAELRRMGHGVTLLDSLPEAGGMLLAGIPRFHLPEEARRADVALLNGLGVEQRYGVNVGQDLGFDELRTRYDAVLLAIGTHLGHPLGVRGENLAGILDGIAFLRQVNLGERLVLGPKVLVIGAGNVAVDSARVALRLGAQDVQLACLETREEMPAFPAQLEGALKEGITFNCTWGPEEFLASGGRVTAAILKRCLSVWAAGGTFRPAYDMGQRQTLPADTVIVAAGQGPDLGFLAQAGGLGILRGGSLRVSPSDMQIGRSGVFAAGDMVSGPSSVVEAMASGRRAAHAIDRFLRGQTPVLHRVLREGNPLQAKVDVRSARRHPRIPVPQRASLERRSSFDLVELGFDAAAARSEADRCLRCGRAVEYYQECWYCLPCEIQCPTKALTLELPFLVR